jgi:hypothetical protein
LTTPRSNPLLHCAEAADADNAKVIKSFQRKLIARTSCFRVSFFAGQFIYDVGRSSKNLE